MKRATARRRRNLGTAVVERIWVELGQQKYQLRADEDAYVSSTRQLRNISSIPSGRIRPSSIAFILS